MNRWPIHKAYLWEHAPFFRALIPFVLGITGYGLYHGGNIVYALAVALLSLLLLAPALKRNSNKTMLLFVAMHCFLLSGGYAIAYLNDDANNPVWYGSHANSNSTCVARIAAPPAEKERTWKMQVNVIRTISNGRISNTTGKGIVYLYKDNLPMLYHAGDTVLLPYNWQPVQNSGNPYEFNHAQYLRRNNIYLQQFCSGGAVRLYALHNNAERPYTERVHNWCMLQLDTYISDKKTKGLIQAMLLGDEVNLDEDLRQSFSDTGIVHVIAISGGNIMMFFTLIAFLLRWIKNKKYSWISYVIALPLIWFYVLMAGASPSAIRAAIMFSLLAGGILMSKNNNSLNQLLGTAFVLLVAQPMWLYSLGFQLSFVAVLSLITFYGPIYKMAIGWYVPNARKWIIWCYKQTIQIICASLAAEILVAPLVIYYFHNFPTLFLIANVLAYVFMGAVLVLGMFTILISPLPVVASAAGMVTTWLVAAFSKLLDWLQLFNPESFHFLRVSTLQMLLLYITIAGIALLLLRRIKAGLFVSLASLCLFTLLLCTDKYSSLHQQRLVVYNTGKANHIELIEGNKYAMLYTDTGTTKRTKYATMPAHIEWQAWQEYKSAIPDVLRIGNKTVLVLNEPPYGTQHFPIDYVIVNYNTAPDLKSLYTTFSPKCIVVGINYARKEQAALIAAAQDAHIDIHLLNRDGAFVLN